MSEFKIVLFGPPDEPASTMGYAPTFEDAKDETASIADYIENHGSLPMDWDIAWPVPAAVLNRYKNGNLRIRCDSYERESETGSTLGIGRIEIIEVTS
jgi:hypothetical protein